MHGRSTTQVPPTLPRAAGMRGGFNGNSRRGKIVASGFPDPPRTTGNANQLASNDASAVDNKPPQKPVYVSARYLVGRWMCSRAAVDRYTRDAGFTRFMPGSGRNGCVRFKLSEVEAWEDGRQS